MMIRFKGNDIKAAIDAILTAEFESEKEYEMIIKLHRKKRSKDANAYFWEFLDKLAVRLRIGKDELYRELIRDIGGVSHTLVLEKQAADHFQRVWKANGKGWFCEIEPNTRYPNCVTVTAYYGSSQYTTEQMARLIDKLLFECNIAGIDTTDLKTKALLEVKNE